MKLALIVIAVVVGFVGAIAVIGACLPRAHRATRSAFLSRRPSEIYAVIRDFAAMPSWRTDLPAVELLPPRGGLICFREVSPHRSMAYIVLEDSPPNRIVTKIADENLPFGGTWTYEILAEPSGSRVRITEQGEIKNVIFRLLARFVFGYTTTMEAYLRDLGKKFGETVIPAP